MYPLNKQLQDIENQAGKEFEYLLAVGAKYFSTDELLELRGVWKARYRLFCKFQKIVILLGASSPGWILVGFTLSLLGFQGLAFYATMLFPITFVLSIAGAFWLKSEFESKGFLEHVGTMINSEIKHRITEKDNYKWN